ncbi:MAG TPA: hypothetical protein DHV62_00955, partial [Elusimicrobia bacterium]|nr:hypothetical protein [Elusimicrobiota bacterium]
MLNRIVKFIKKCFQFLLVVFVSFVFEKDYTYGNTVEYPIITPNVNVGAKATSLGGSYVSIADEVSSIYWNPAGLSQILKPEIESSVSIFNSSFIQSEHFSLASFGFAYPTRFGTVGIGSYLPIDYYLLDSDLNSEDKIAHRLSIFSYGINIFSYMSLGVSLSQVLQSEKVKLPWFATEFISEQKGVGWEYSIGYLIRLAKWCNLGGNMRLPYKINWERKANKEGIEFTGSDSIPFRHTNGISFHLENTILSVEYENRKWSDFRRIKKTGTDQGKYFQYKNYWKDREQMNALKDDETLLKIGFVINYFKGIISLRGGFAKRYQSSDSKINELSLGTGFIIGNHL